MQPLQNVCGLQFHAWGMIAATHIALATGKLDSVTAGRISNSVLGFGRLPRMKLQATNILKRLHSDKKTRQEWSILFCPVRSAR